MPVIIGMDGCRCGWLCLTEDLARKTIEARVLSRFDEILAFKAKPQVAMVDIPIGLTDRGPRECDKKTRARLGKPRSNSVFPAPIRSMLKVRNYEMACRIGEKVDGRKISRQSWAIIPKIKEVDDFLQINKDFQSRIWECHPELCFYFWNKNKPMVFGKKNPSGKAEREKLVLGKYGQPFRDARRNLPRGMYAADDLLDAFAALWSAERFINERSKCEFLPKMAPLDSCGLRMQITA